MQNSFIFWKQQTDTQEAEKHKQMTANTWNPQNNEYIYRLTALSSVVSKTACP